MKIDAVAVSTSNMLKTVEFYKLLGFEFPEFKSDDGHVEAVTRPGEIRLMIDTKDLMKGILNYEVKPSNHSNFAILYDSADELNRIAKNVKDAGFTVFKEPWDAFWGQRYCIVHDPDGYLVDLFVNL